MPSCLSTRVKLAKQPCRCASRESSRGDRNFVKEEPGRQRRGGAEPEQWRGEPESNSGGGAARAAVTEDRGASRGRRNRGRASRVGGNGERVGGTKTDPEPAANEKRGEQCAGGEDRARHAARRTTNFARGARESEGRRRALREEGQSRRVAVDVDDESGRRRRRWWRGLCGGRDRSAAEAETKVCVCREGSRRMGCWFLPFFGQRQTMYVADLSLICSRSVTDFATDQRQTCFCR
ncbi:hypothetical protein Scep_022455 [Stephania cephalantha]|uniref:Uncharacterized protein n=1 Tax=Stephania cephalantha TaxID=152367 RepID=A0AAP0F6E4_9MAGN